MDSGQSFFLEYNDGSGWQTAATWVPYSDFSKIAWYFADCVIIDARSMTNIQLRFRCDGSVSNDRVFIDDVTLEGTTIVSEKCEVD
jgi:hypothetical protein